MKKIFVFMLVFILFILSSCASQISRDEYSDLNDDYAVLEDKYDSVSGKYDRLSSLVDKMYNSFLTAYNYFDDPVTTYTQEDAYGALIEMHKYFNQLGY